MKTRSLDTCVGGGSRSAIYRRQSRHSGQGPTSNASRSPSATNGRRERSSVTQRKRAPIVFPKPLTTNMRIIRGTRNRYAARLNEVLGLFSAAESRNMARFLSTRTSLVILRMNRQVHPRMRRPWASLRRPRGTACLPFPPALYMAVACVETCMTVYREVHRYQDGYMQRYVYQSVLMCLGMLSCGCMWAWEIWLYVYVCMFRQVSIVSNIE